MPADPFLIVGRPAANHKQVGVLEAENLYSYAAATIELSSIYQAIPKPTSGRALIGFEKAASFIGAVVEKFEVLQNWAKEGHTLSIVLDCIPEITYASKEGRQVTWSAERINLIAGLDLTAAKGNNAIAATSFSELSPWEKHIYYQFSFSTQMEPVFNAGAAIRGNEKAIGGCWHTGKGKIYFIPPLGLADRELLGNYYAAVSTHKTTQIAESVPDWIKSYTTSAETSTISTVTSKQAEIEHLQSDIAQLSEILIAQEADKRLLFSHNETFSEAAHIALIELGFDVSKGPAGRADLIAFQDGKLLAIEAKGLEGSAKERDFRQALQWKAEVEATITANAEDLAENSDYKNYSDALAKLGVELNQDELKIECRAVVIIGTYRTLPLLSRNEPDFPNAVEKVITRSHGTAITGLSLFDLVQQAREKPDLKSELRKLFYQDGVIISRPWQDYLTTPETL